MLVVQSLATDLQAREPPAMGGTARLIEVIQELSLARDLERVMAIVRRAARELTGADGATFVLRDGASCHYVDEDAIEPLWKGQRFPLEACISGWSMLNRAPAIIEDIYADPRVPADAYRPTFVKSLVMVPIRTTSPVGAIGNYWAERHLASAQEVKLLAALADSTSIAMENVHVYQTLEERVRRRTNELEASQRALADKHEKLLLLQRQKRETAELLVHDFKSPAAGIMLASKARLRRADLSDCDRRHWTNVLASAEVIQRMALNLLDLERHEEGTLELRTSEIDLRGVLEEVIELMVPLAEGRQQQLVFEDELGHQRLTGDRELLRRVLQNLIDNALRHNPPCGTVRLRACRVAGVIELHVIDQGPGIPEAMRTSIFERYTRLVGAGAEQAAQGRHGLGLAFCRGAVRALGGDILVESNAPCGSIFTVRLPAA